MQVKDPISIKEAAVLLNKRYGQVMRMLRSGKIPGVVKVGWGWAIPKASITKLAENQDNDTN